MKIIGLTGPSGAGKSHCSVFLERHGIPTVNADAVYHSLISGPSDCVSELVSCFGGEILAADGSVDRKALASVVFGDGGREKIQELNRIAHSYVRIETLRLLDAFRAQDCKAVVIDAPLLFEASFDTFCDFSIAVLAPSDIRRKRIMERDHLTKEEADARLAAQKNNEYYSSRARHIIINDSTAEMLWTRLNDILVREGVLA